MEAFLIILGILVGAAVTFVLTRGQLAEVRRAADDKVRLVTGNREQLTEQMKAISSDALRLMHDQAEASRRADREASSSELAKRTEEIRRSLDPLAQAVQKVETNIALLDRDRRQTQGVIGQMFQTMSTETTRLRSETGRLVSALKRPNVRGSWGEMQLRNCIQAANMTEHVDFLTQPTVEGDEGRLRPDVLVRLPADKTVIVDAKVPMDAYLAALELADSEAQGPELDRHARQVRNHMDTLASKRYQAQFDSSPEFVVMFIPNEAVYCAALERDPTLLEYGASKGVLIATPTTLIALLQAVYYGWRQERIAESAREIAAAGRELHKRVGTFVEPLAKLGRQLGSSVNAYNEAVGSFEARILPQLRRIEEAGAGSDKRLESPAPLDTPARMVTAVGLVGPPADPDGDADGVAEAA
jgi:DNA recombination protein RmuC